MSFQVRTEQFLPSTVAEAAELVSRSIIPTSFVELHTRVSLWTSSDVKPRLLYFRKLLIGWTLNLDLQKFDFNIYCNIMINTYLYLVINEVSLVIACNGVLSSGKYFWVNICQTNQFLSTNSRNFLHVIEKHLIDLYGTNPSMIASRSDGRFSISKP